MNTSEAFGHDYLKSRLFNVARVFDQSATITIDY